MVYRKMILSDLRHLRHPSVGERVMFSGCLSPRSFIRSSGQILLSQYLMSSFSKLEETHRE